LLVTAATPAAAGLSTATTMAPAGASTTAAAVSTTARSAATARLGAAAGTARPSESGSPRIRVTTGTDAPRCRPACRPATGTSGTRAGRCGSLRVAAAGSRFRAVDVILRRLGSQALIVVIAVKALRVREAMEDRVGGVRGLMEAGVKVAAEVVEGRSMDGAGLRGAMRRRGIRGLRDPVMSVGMREPGSAGVRGLIRAVVAVIRTSGSGVSNGGCHRLVMPRGVCDGGGYVDEERWRDMSMRREEKTSTRLRARSDCGGPRIRIQVAISGRLSSKVENILRPGEFS
jgi:hypothetical protein